MTHDIRVWKEVPRDCPAHFFPFAWMLPNPLSLLRFFFVVSVTFAQSWKSNPFVPPAIPLAVKSPYLQTWLQQGAVEGSLNSGWQFFHDKSVWIRPKLLQLLPDADWWAYTG